ncbi:hypothetical protein VPH35_018557 [Triticum aestivum]
MVLVLHGGGAGGSATMAMPMLIADNYTVWAIKAQAILDVRTVWEAVVPGDAAVNAWKDKMGRALLLGALPEDVLLQVSKKLTVREVWDSLRFIGADRVGAARLAMLHGEFDRLKMAGGEDLDVYGGRLAAMAARYANLVETLGDAALVKKLLDTVSDRLFPGHCRHRAVPRRDDDGVRRSTRAAAHVRRASWASTAGQRQQGGARDDDDGNNVASGSGGTRRRRCYKCGEHGHFRRECPQLRKGPAAEQALLAGANVDDDRLL